MAKTAEAPAMPKVEPKASISWPSPERTEGKKGIKLTGDISGIALGKTCRVVLEGTVTGFRMDEWGCSLDLKTKAIKVEYVHDASGEDDEEYEDMTELVDRMQGKKKKA